MKQLSAIISLILTAILTLLCLTGCDTAAKGDRFTVAVSIAPQKTFAQKICGDKAEIILTVPAGASAESYEMKPKEITALNKADLYFSIGIPAEQNGILPHLNKDTLSIPLNESVSDAYNDINIGDSRDPHIWLSPKRAIVIAEEMAKEIEKADPDNADFYRQNAEKLKDELNSLKNEIGHLFRDKKLKVFYIAHPSYGYFAEDFGLKMVAIEKHGQEATSKDLAVLTGEMKEQSVKTVFCQEEVSKKQAELIADEIGANVEVLKPLSEDYFGELRRTAQLIYKAVN